MERANLCPAIGHMVLLRYVLESNACGQGLGAGKFFSGSGSWLFSQVVPAPGIFFSSGSGSKGPKKLAPAPDYLLSLAKHSFLRKLA